MKRINYFLLCLWIFVVFVLPRIEGYFGLDDYALKLHDKILISASLINVIKFEMKSILFLYKYYRFYKRKIKS